MLTFRYEVGEERHGLLRLPCTLRHHWGEQVSGSAGSVLSLDCCLILKHYRNHNRAGSLDTPARKLQGQRLRAGAVMETETKS